MLTEFGAHYGLESWIPIAPHYPYVVTTLLLTQSRRNLYSGFRKDPRLPFKEKLTKRNDFMNIQKMELCLKIIYRHGLRKLKSKYNLFTKL